MAISASSPRGGARAEINVTPMADVMLVLLIIFMIVTPIITSGFQAVIPKGNNPEDRAEEPDEILLGIDRNGNFFLNTRPISAEALPGQLQALYLSRTKDKILYLKADQEILFGRVQAAVEMARKAGVRVVGAITEQKQVLFGKRKKQEG